ncbi:hypothetical protein AAFF_G00437860 [Aldrovandia affinis]|uniref:Ubiquitin carboxyl-terminal hydrolase n=1 Tax=Aldrovandia affinis TaxID=143900 RepID=A0AAD7S7P6_9TELE|nr:hypothetical protein AAFF_G00437860 [Aldrovandia affinis]
MTVRNIASICNMGTNASALEKDIGPEQFPINEHYFGLVNFGNTCYCNSVLQALYFCRPFRENVLAYKAQQKKKENLLTCLADLFHSIATQKKKVGVIPPKKFISRLRKENDLFDNYMQQDAHEFLNYLLNTVADILQEERNGPVATETEENKAEPTWVHDIFQGTLTNETRCLNCETVSSKDEDFLDLSVDVEQNTSITHCLRDFSNTETLCSEYKYYCETCCSKQEAQKRMRVKRLPMILALHLKRFKYMEQLHRYTKLSYRVVFPLELRLFNTSGDAVNLDRMYDLVAVVVHCGSGPNRGHYITIVKSHGFWLLFDDDIVEKIDAQAIEEFYGLTSDISKNSESGTHRDAVAMATPRQRPIDVILARRATERWDRERQNHDTHRKLREKGEQVKRELRALHLDTAQTESSNAGGCHDDAAKLQACAQQAAQTLPTLQTAVMELRKEVQKQAESESAPKLPQNPKTMYQSLSEVVSEALEDDLRHYTTQIQLHQEDRSGETTQRDRAIHLTVELIILEVTLDLATEIAHELHNIATMCRTLSFDLILSSAQQVVGGSPGEDVSALTHTILQQQLNRETNQNH